MIDLDRMGERLSVRTRPSVWYQSATWACFGLALGIVLWGGTGSTAAVAGACAAALALVLNWTTTEFRVDRPSATLFVAHRRPLRAASSRSLPFADVSGLFERSAQRARTLELMLADATTLEVARARGGDASQLGTLARELSEWLQKPLCLAPGSAVDGRFVVERLAGQGGMGVVYRARDLEGSQSVALKLIAARSGEGLSAERFAREIQLLASFDHPHIVKYVASGTLSGERAYLAMEWLDGEDLATRLKRGPLTADDSLCVLRTAARALAVVHARSVVHRDIKPSNLFLRAGAPAQLALLDFGVARQLDVATHLTGARALIGTPHYMAPEQAANAPQLGAAADLFSLGCIFYECLSGKRPFAASHMVGVLARILYDEPEPLGAEHPEAYRGLLSLLLAKRPEHRPSDAPALLELLERIERGSLTGAAAISGSTQPLTAVDQVLVCVVLASFSGTPPRFDPLRSSLERFGCPLEQLADGSVLATVLPQSSAVDQVRIAARIALNLLTQLPGARIALATGPAPYGSAPRVGTAADRAAQLVQRELAHDAVRLDSVSAGLLEGRFEVARDGETILLIAEHAELDATRPLLGKPTPCVGRELELGQLEVVLASAIQDSAAKAALVLGPPGIGKSRLRHEFLRRSSQRHPDQLLLIGFGDPLSTGSPYVLLADALRRHANIRAGAPPAESRAQIRDVLCRRIELQHRQRVSEFLGELCGVPFPAEASPPLAAARAEQRVMSEQIDLAFHDWLAAESAVQPVVVVLEDVQWGDALTLKLVQAALRDLDQSPLCVLAFGRPESETVLPGLAGLRRTFSINLRPLPNAASEALVSGVLADAISGAGRARIVELAAGNALFLEELIRAAADGNLADTPETILAMLQARLSRLPIQARTVLRAASVLGETFWRGGVEHICRPWGLGDPDPWLEQLVETEIISRRRSSQYPGDVEYAFRHALVCDAARGLLTDTDLQAAHRAAGEWLEQTGESDCVVLARHAERGGDLERSFAHYLRAAEQSLERRDATEALARAAKASAVRADTDLPASLLVVQTAAHYQLGDWTAAADCGQRALERVPRGSAAWCSMVEMLTQVLPNIGESERGAQLIHELLRIDPEPALRPQYLRTVYTQLMGFAIGALRAEGEACLRYIDAQPDPEPDIMTRGYSNLWRGLFESLLSPDSMRALALGRAAVRDLSATQVWYRVSIAHMVEAFSLWALGQHGEAERAGRNAVSVAQEIRDDYHTAVASWYLGLALCEQRAAEKLEEAEHRARQMFELHSTPVFECTSQTLLARIAMLREDWASAEEYGRKARIGLAAMPAYRFLGSVALLRSLRRQERAREAAELAEEELAYLERVQGTVTCDVSLRVEAAEALFAHGEREAAERTLRAALAGIQLRAGLITDPAFKQSYLDEREEVVHAFALAERERIKLE